MQHSRGICTLLKATLPAIAIACALLGKPAVAEQDFTQQMHLLVNGENLTLLLRPGKVTENMRVVDNNGVALNSGVDTYTGRIKGDKDSWARITRGASSIDGIISRYGKRFRVQQSHGSAMTVKPLADNHDLRVTLTSNGSNRNALSTIHRSEVTRVAKIGVIVDSKYNDRHNGNGLEYALSIINAVDGIYREEFGLALQVETAIDLHDSANDPFDFGNVDIETMLRGLRAYRMQSTLLGNEVSLVHLFSGNRAIDEPVGLAWIDTACRSDGYDVGLSTPYQHDILLAAHEIAHNLGALHDSETACAASTDKVMWPYISSGTSQQFSRCTVETVKRKLINSCHAEAIDLELALSVDSSNTVQATIRNTDTLRATPAATLAIDLPEGGTATTLQGNCDHNLADEIECSIGTIAPGADSVVVFQLNTEVTDELLASVEPDEYIDVLQHNNTGSITRNDNEQLVVTAEHLPQADLLTPQTNLPSHQTAAGGGNSGTGCFTALPLILIVALRRRISNRT